MGLELLSAKGFFLKLELNLLTVRLYAQLDNLVVLADIFIRYDLKTINVGCMFYV